MHISRILLRSPGTAGGIRDSDDFPPRSPVPDAGISWIALVAEPDSENFYLPLGFARMEGHVPLIYRGAPDA